MDSEYIRELGRKTHRGLEGQARRGFSAGGIAYGYHREVVHEAGLDREGQPLRMGVRWAVEPTEAEVVRGIFQTYREGRGLAAIAARLNASGVPAPRQAKGHRARRDGIGAGWDLSAVRVILGNALYRGRLIWNRSRWIRAPGSRRRQRVPRPEAEWVVLERPDLRIVDEALWASVQGRRAEVRAHYDQPRQFGKARTAYGTYLLSGRLVCAECQGTLSIRTGRPQRYGCTRHWRRGAAACPNNLLVRRDLTEMRVLDLLRARLYTPDGITRLVDAVNTRLRARGPEIAAEQERGRIALQQVRQQLTGLRRFVEEGDTSAKVRQWLGEAEEEEGRLDRALAEQVRVSQRPSVQVHPSRVARYLQDLVGTLARRDAQARQLIQADIDRIVIHPVRGETAKPFARAEVVTTGKGLLDRVAFVVAGAGFEPATFGL